MGMGVMGGRAMAQARVDNYAAGGINRGEPIPFPIPPWPGEYKLKPTDRDKLTAADVVGPDGIVYPNWTQVGVQGGIPDVPVAVKLEDMGAKPETDISGLLAKACEEVGAKGGGAILIGKGTFYLDNPILITQSGVVIRGSGRDATRLVFRYSVINPKAEPPKGWPERSVFMFQGGVFSSVKHQKEPAWRGMLQANFMLLAADAKRGDTKITIEEKNKFGATIDKLPELPHRLKVGDKFILRAPTTPQWEELIKGRALRFIWGVRVGYYEIRAIEGNTITINQPLRIDFPVVRKSDGTLDGGEYGGSRMMPFTKVIERCGIEDLTIEHTCKMLFHTVSSQWAWNCWVRRVNVLNSGRSGVHFASAKWCEVRDCEFDSTWARGGGGVGYGGFTQSSDCLMENTRWINYRHAPVVQFAAQGNVFRNSTFEGSDAQWHAGWATENLFENCVILPARTKHSDDTPRNPSTQYGTYGFGMYSTPSHDTQHGSNGPRNVVYNCDVTSRRDGVYGRGASENWIFVHNRFVVTGDGAGGFYVDSAFFDTIIRNNVFVLKDPSKPMLFIRTPDCVGIELLDNTVYGGSGKIVEGVTTVAVDKGNKALPALKPGEAIPDRPKADPPSIYEWQNRKQ